MVKTTVLMLSGTSTSDFLSCETGAAKHRSSQESSTSLEVKDFFLSGFGVTGVSPLVVSIMDEDDVASTTLLAISSPGYTNVSQLTVNVHSCSVILVTVKDSF